MTENGHEVVSVIIPGYNRHEALSHTLSILQNDDYPELEIIVVDNGSSDGTVEKLKEEFPEVKCIALSENLGIKARNIGAKEALGKYLLMLDSDSDPAPDSISKMVSLFKRDPNLGAVAFRNILPNQSNQDETGGSYNVFVGCGVGFKKKIFLELCGYDPDYHYYAEEYDLAYRLIEAGYRVKYFSDLVVRHHKSPDARSFDRTIRYLVRNNIYLYFKYFPFSSALHTARWVLYRYWKIACWKNVQAGFWRGVADGAVRVVRSLMDNKKLSQNALDQVLPERFCGEKISRAIKENGINKVAFWGVGKDFYGFVRGAQKSNLQVVGAFPTEGQPYFCTKRKVFGIPILGKSKLFDIGDAKLVIASASPGETENEMRYLAQIENAPVPIPLFSYYPGSCG